MRSAMGDPQFADLSIAALEGRSLGLSELQHACDSIPFLCDKRLVIVAGMLARFEPRRKKGGEDAVDASREAQEEINPELAQALKEYLPRLPNFADLVFVESKTLAKNNPILKLAQSDKAHARVVEFQPPSDRELPGWILKRVAKKQGTIETKAAEELAAHIGADLRLIDNEIDKLLAYCGEAPIRPADVQVLVPSVHEANIFHLVDAIGARETKRAVELLHEHLERNAAPLYLLSMITRQFRMIFQVKDLAVRRMNVNAIASKLRLQPFIATKVSEQARNFTIPQLEETYRKLLETDLAIKTSRSDPVVALDMLVIELTRM